MPSRGLCRVGSRIVPTSREYAPLARHNQRLLRKANRLSSGRYRFTRISSGVVRPRAASLQRKICQKSRSHWTPCVSPLAKPFGGPIDVFTERAIMESVDDARTVKEIRDHGRLLSPVEQPAGEGNRIIPSNSTDNPEFKWAQAMQLGIIRNSA
jgi:hypothetical protein